jgi:hypothetical protein
MPSCGQVYVTGSVGDDVITCPSGAVYVIF